MTTYYTYDIINIESEVRIINAKELLKIAIKNNWNIRSQKGSHVKLIHTETGKVAIIPFHGSKDIPIGTTNSILKQLGLK